MEDDIILESIHKLADPSPKVRKTASGLLEKCPNRQEVLNAYLHELPQADRELAIVLLQKIEKEGRHKSGVAPRLIPLLEHPDYLVRSRVFITLGRLQDRSVSLDLVDYVGKNPGEEWQLRALDCLFSLKDQNVVPKLSAFLSHNHNPLLVRGIIWLLGYLGGKESLEVITRFASSPQGRIVKNEVILEAVALALNSIDDGKKHFEELKKEKPHLSRFFRYSCFPEVDPPRFFVYPYPDYLLDRAAAEGISSEEFKKLSYWDRKS